jgi:hypothetical protein
MPRLIVQQNQIGYRGTFGRPAFPLWGEGRAIVLGLYEAFSPYGATLADITLDNTGGPADQGMTVNIRGNGTFAFRFEYLDWTLQGFAERDLVVVPAILESGVRWVRAIVKEGLFQSHLFSYASHAQIEGATSREFLSDLSGTKLSIGEDLGSGVIFNFDLDRQARVQVIVDHSLLIQDGLFIQQQFFVRADQINYEHVMTLSRGSLEAALNTLQLRFPKSPA